MCCDFVLVTADLARRVKRVEYELETQASDHQPVIIELR
jgi:endonuclease/exonuclease/phosphatase family metal-dependent hydrolase